MIFTKRHAVRHLQGKKTYAPYQLSSDGKVKWLCIDIDAAEGATEESVRSVTKSVVTSIVEYLGLNTALVEESGAKGFHVWVLFNAPVPVGKAHLLGHRLIQGIALSDNITLEVYPKQVTPKKFGNVVKLPLGVHQKTQQRCWFVDKNFEVYEDQWTRLNCVARVSSTWLEHNIEEPEVAAVRTTEEGESGTTYVPLCLTNILREGSPDGMWDDSAFRLSCYLRDKGIPEEYAQVMLTKWNTKNPPPDDPEKLAIKIESAYNNDYGWFPCMLQSFDKVCTSQCTFFERKVERRWKNHNPKESPIGIISRD
jgi:hypothetical protein